MANFSEVPILDYSLLSNPTTRQRFIDELQHALINVGFFYLSNPPVRNEDFDAVVSYAPKFFDLPPDEKERIRMVHSPHFFGYSRFGAEFTAGGVDQREQFDFATEYESRWKPGDPDYRRLWGPSQWPDEALLPGFKDTYVRYTQQVDALGYKLVELIAAALHLPSGAFFPFLHPGGSQNRAKIVKYPVPEDSKSDQGVGPHYDGGFLTLLLQASPHRGLQVQNKAGEWIDAPPVPGTFVVNIGKALETVTQGAAIATTHRVISPAPGSTPRYSIPFFQIITQELVIGKSVLELPPEIVTLKEARGGVETAAVNFSEYNDFPAGEVNLIGRIKSHPDVGQRHYTERFNKIFPEGLPAHGSAY